tara:strand:- start:70 stop:666 length:597 start_codon:yes stop_codon:yes gene_type:complete
MGLFPLVTHSSGLRFGYESGNVSGAYSKSATSITALKGSNQVIHLQYRTPYTIVFGLEAGQATLSGIKSSDGTDTKYNFAHQFLGLNLGLELENRYFSLIIAPQIVFPIISTGTYNYEKSGNTNIVSQKLSSKTGLSGYEVPVYFDLTNFYIGFKILNYTKNDMTINYATGETEKIGYTKGITLMLGWKSGKKSRKKR